MSALFCHGFVVHVALGIGLGQAASLPPIGFGTANILDLEPILEALQLGYRFIDTATLYGNHKVVGDALRRSNLPRHEVHLLTKVGFWPETFLHPLLRKLRGWSTGIDNFVLGSKGSEAEALQAAVRELGVEYIDACLVHSPVTTWSEFLLAFMPHRFGRFGFFALCQTGWGS